MFHKKKNILPYCEKKTQDVNTLFLGQNFGLMFQVVRGENIFELVTGRTLRAMSKVRDRSEIRQINGRQRQRREEVDLETLKPEDKLLERD